MINQIMIHKANLINKITFKIINMRKMFKVKIKFNKVFKAKKFLLVKQYSKIMNKINKLLKYRRIFSCLNRFHSFNNKIINNKHTIIQV